MSVFVPTTIIAPPIRSVYVNRPVLEALADQIASSRLTTICAPAGSGKTMAAQHLFNGLKSAGRPAIWLAVRAGIRDLGSFLLALKNAGVAAGLRWHELDPKGDHMVWFSGLASHGDQKPVIVIDDAQLLPKDVLEFLGQAITSARDAITTIVVSRGAIGIPLARQRALGFLVEVGSNELNFSRSEATELVSRIVGDMADTETIRQLIDDAGGWASGLVIGANHCRRKTVRGAGHVPLDDSLLPEFTSYFNEEVLALQPQDVREFLIDTSILDELTAAACTAVTGSENAPTTLDAAFRAGLFLNPVERKRGCYTYHPLFRKSVVGELMNSAPARAAELHRRASRYYAASGEGLIAFEHAKLSGDQTFIADQLEHLANELIYAGYLYRIDDLASEIPWSVISSRPMLLLAMAWRRIRRLSFSAAERFINAAAAIAETRPEDITLGHLVRHRRIMLEAARDNLELVEVAAQELLDELGDDEPYLSCTLVAQLMSARRELYHFHDILKLEAETRRALGRPGSEFASIALKSTVAPTLVVQGKTQQARRFLEEALALAEERQGKGSGLAALPALPLAEILYDVGELDLAADLVERHLPTVRQWGFVDQLAAGFLVRARLAFARGDTAAALSGLEEAHLIAIECGLDRLRVFVVAEQVRILTKTGKVVDAKAALRCGSINTETEPVPTLTSTRRDESIAIAWLRIELLGQRLTRAEKVATRWLDQVKRTAAIRSIVVFQLLVAEIAVLRGDRSKARRAVRAAVELAEPSGWTQIFLDEGEAICSLLREAYTDDPTLETTPADIFGCRLVTLMHSGPRVEIEANVEDSTCLISSLSSREIKILSMVSVGLRNREIGERLGLTEGTVKWYMQQAYQKLGVRRRTQVVIRARQLGILS